MQQLSAMAAPSVAGTGLVGFTVAMATQDSGSAIDVRRGEPAAAQAEGKNTHRNSVCRFGAFSF